MRWSIALGTVAALGATGFGVLSCSASGRGPGASGGAGGAAAAGGAGGSGAVLGSCNTCQGEIFRPCDSARNPLPTEDCRTAGLVCVNQLGCRPCGPNGLGCVGNVVHRCNADGQPVDPLETCDPAQGLVCNAGRCSTECDAVAGSPSNVGCEFWAVDLPNERVVTLPGTPAAKDQAWGVILANAGTTAAHVTVERNRAAVGQPLDLEVVATQTIPVGDVAALSLPQAELTGPTVTEPPGPPGSQLTSRAFRVTATAPVVAYQFNPFRNSYTNDASLLLPRSGLGTLHRVLGYTPSKPVAVPGFNVPGVPERAFVTVVGVEPGTRVRFVAGGRVNTDGSVIPNMVRGDSFEITLGPFDVLNVASNGMPGDLTGSVVEASRPVAVFSSTETSTVVQPNLPPDAKTCCTDHLEEQIFPVTALGKVFVVTRSPPRGTSTVEPDLVRFLGIAEPATVTTNLPGADAQFTLQPGELREVWVRTDFVAESSAPVLIGQLLVSQEQTENYEGDASFTIFPPVEQYRSSYAFIIPPSWPKNYVVISATDTSSIRIDGNPLAGCTTEPAGPLQGVNYSATRCLISMGLHRITGEVPFGITVYGYSGPGSFAFAGGADVKPIYEPPPVL